MSAYHACNWYALCVADEVHVSNIHLLEFANEDVDVYEGHKSVQWRVNVTASSPTKLVWYGPNCTILEVRDGPTRHEVYISPSEKTTRLKIYDVSVADRGLYRLQARNEEGEEWAYFALNVKGEARFELRIIV